jgi:hypothetical protein
MTNVRPKRRDVTNEKLAVKIDAKRETTAAVHSQREQHSSGCCRRWVLSNIDIDKQ